MENMDLQSNLAMMEDIEFEEKVDIDDLVLPSKPTKSTEIEMDEIKQEPVEEEKLQSAVESDYNVGKIFKVKMEENILKLCEELDKEKSENSTMDFSQRRSLKIRKLVEQIDAQYDSVDHPQSSQFLFSEKQFRLPFDDLRYHIEQYFQQIV